MTKPIISVENLSKAYRLGHKEEVPDTLVGAATSVLKAPFRNFKRLGSMDMKDGGEADDILWALKDVSFDVHEGEVVGIIGRNGAGKSTLLKILSRITEPTSGCVKLRGRVSSLLEVGTGFHPELTGRDNVYMNGTILGMKKREIDAKFDEIVDFSGVEKFLDTPVKRYSSGMLVRLAFAVAAHLEPEILIVDEVLAVGDAEFQKKCLGKMQDVSSSGRTVLFVSHNMAAVQSLCGRGIILCGGQVSTNDEINNVIEKYYRSMVRDDVSILSERTDRSGTGKSKFQRIWLETEQGKEIQNGMIGMPLRICLECEGELPVNKLEYKITFYDYYGVPLACMDSTVSGKCEIKNGRSRRVECFIPELLLAPGSYRINIAVADDAMRVHDRIEGATILKVEPAGYYPSGKLPDSKYSRFIIKHEWRV